MHSKPAIETGDSALYTREAVHVFDRKIGKAVYDLDFEIRKTGDDLPLPRFVGKGTDTLHVEVSKGLNDFDFVVRKALNKLNFAVNIRQLRFVGAGTAVFQQHNPAGHADKRGLQEKTSRHSILT